MYAIYGNIYHQYTPFMLAYIPYMDPMGYITVYIYILYFYHHPYLSLNPSTLPGTDLETPLSPQRGAAHVRRREGARRPNGGFCVNGVGLEATNP